MSTAVLSPTSDAEEILRLRTVLREHPRKFDCCHGGHRCASWVVAFDRLAEAGLPMWCDEFEAADRPNVVQRAVGVARVLTGTTA
jgi:hypothetical protein